MQLLRLALAYFDPAPSDWNQWRMKLDDIEVGTVAHGVTDGKLRLLIAATAPVGEELVLTPGEPVEIPTEPRRQAEFAIESAANLVSIAAMCKRSISSPTPYVALIPPDNQTQARLDETAGLALGGKAIGRFQNRIGMDSLSSNLGDRLDGVALLSESARCGCTAENGRFRR